MPWPIEIYRSPNGVNLDSEDTSDLLAFALLCTGANENARYELAADIFPNVGRSMREGVLEQLGRYAHSIVLARNSRQIGAIGFAIRYENTAELIYSTLPQWAKW